MDDSLSSLRASLKFSLWAWAAYWPGCGLLLLGLGMSDPASLAVVAVTTAGFLLAMASGALRLQDDRTIAARRHLIERPLYLLAILAVVMVASSAMPGSANVGLVLFSGLYLASIVYALTRLRAHLRATGKGLFSSGADQLVLLLVGAGLLALLVFLDAGLPSLGLPSTNTPGGAVALFNVLNLMYPVFLLVAAKPFREALRLPKGNVRVRLVVERAPAAAPQTLQE